MGGRSAAVQPLGPFPKRKRLLETSWIHQGRRNRRFGFASAPSKPNIPPKVMFYSTSQPSGHTSWSPKGPHPSWLRPRALLRALHLLPLCGVVASETLESWCSLRTLCCPDNSDPALDVPGIMLGVLLFKYGFRAVLGTGW